MHNRQKGVVIILALFFLALIATMSYWMMGRLERDTRRVNLILRYEQAEDYAKGSIAWAMEQLRDNLAKQKPNQLVDKLPIRSPVDVMNGYHIESTITDLQGRFNLNSLSDIKAQLQFKRLLRLLKLNLNDQQVDELVQAIVDWISPNQTQNMFSQYYLNANPAYRAAHRMMFSASELRLVKGVTPLMMEQLQPYVTALPTTVPINVLTAEAPILASLSEMMTMSSGQELQKLLANQPVFSIPAFLSIDLVKNHKIPEDNLTTVSTYFLVETQVTVEKQSVVLYTLLERLSLNGQPRIHLLWQSKGVMG